MDLRRLDALRSFSPKTVNIGKLYSCEIQNNKLVGKQFSVVFHLQDVVLYFPAAVANDLLGPVRQEGRTGRILTPGTTWDLDNGK